MTLKPKIGFVGFGEVNTPREIISRKCDAAIDELKSLIDADYFVAGPVSDDEGYVEADRAVRELSVPGSVDLLIVCIAGWIPTHAVIRVTDKFRNIPMLLWGLCGWYENGRLVSTADQAGTTALRFTMSELGYRFRFVYSVVGKPSPIGEIIEYARAAFAVSRLRNARIGTMGYRDMLLYGTQFDGLSLRREIGIEVEPFEMLEIDLRARTLGENQVKETISLIRSRFTIEGTCDDELLEPYARFALAVSERINRRGYDAISLIDVDGMKKLLNLPPSMIFMLIDLMTGASTIPENDVMGSATQLITRYLTGQVAAYAEFYEFFENSILMGVPDFIPREVTLGDARIRPCAFGLFSTSLLNVSKFKDGRITLARLIYTGGKYAMHLAAGEAEQPPLWEECGWEHPAPRLPSLEVRLDCPVREFADKVASQHTIVSYGDHCGAFRQLCYLLNIRII